MLIWFGVALALAPLALLALFLLASGIDYRWESHVAHFWLVLIGRAHHARARRHALERHRPSARRRRAVPGSCWPSWRASWLSRASCVWRKTPGNVLLGKYVGSYWSTWLFGLVVRVAACCCLGARAQPAALPAAVMRARAPASSSSFPPGSLLPGAGTPALRRGDSTSRSLGEQARRGQVALAACRRKKRTLFSGAAHPRSSAFIDEAGRCSSLSATPSFSRSGGGDGRDRLGPQLDERPGGTGTCSCCRPSSRSPLASRCEGHEQRTARSIHETLAGQGREHLLRLLGLLHALLAERACAWWKPTAMPLRVPSAGSSRSWSGPEARRTSRSSSMRRR